jgi:hypothetical protein
MGRPLQAAEGAAAADLKFSSGPRASRALMLMGSCGPEEKAIVFRPFGGE